MAELYIGLMSGTSMNAIDAVLVDLHGQHPQLLQTASHPYSAELRRQLKTLCEGTTDELEKFARLDTELGRLFAETALAVMEKGGIKASEVVAIGSHGQTVRHYPEHGSSLQIADPNIIASITGITTVADFRRRDMSLGGQGAPLVPAFHNLLFRQRGRDRAVLNLGGIANLTILPADPQAKVAGFDTGPGNVLMDQWALRHLKKPLDRDGNWAASGRVDKTLLDKMLRDDYFAAAPPKSTGTEYFNLHWLDRILKRHKGRLIRKNVQTTLCELTVASIVQAVAEHAPATREILVCGGGVHNLALMFRLQILLGDIQLKSTEDYGLHPDWIEAMAFAWLAHETLAGRPGNLPSVTGAAKPTLLGGIYRTARKG
jgi:anhydro-N-acetylmuramic acid kinase